MNKRLRNILIITASVLIVLVSAFFVYVSVYYRADDVAKSVLQSSIVTRVEDDFVVLSPDKQSDTALIFYPGAKVEHLAYLPLLQKITQSSGINCILVKMPFNMAIFNVNAADNVISQFPEIKHWYIGGHSMGGSMASSYASNNQDKVEGLILLGRMFMAIIHPQKRLQFMAHLTQVSRMR